MHLTTCNSALILRHAWKVGYFQSVSTDAANLSGDFIPTSWCAISIPILSVSDVFVKQSNSCLDKMSVCWLCIWFSIAFETSRTDQYEPAQDAYLLLCRLCTMGGFSQLNPFDVFWTGKQAPHIKYVPNASMAIETCQIKSYYVYRVFICLPSRVLGIFWVFPPGPTNRKHDPLLDRGWCTKVIEIIKTQTCTGNAFTTSNSEWWGKQWHCGVQQSRILYILLCFRLRLLLVSTQRDWCNVACAELNGGNSNISNTVLCRVPHAKVSAVEPDPRDNRHIKSHRNIFPSTFHEFKKGLKGPKKTNWTLNPSPTFPTVI